MLTGHMVDMVDEEDVAILQEEHGLMKRIL